MENKNENEGKLQLGKPAFFQWRGNLPVREIECKKEWKIKTFMVNVQELNKENRFYFTWWPFRTMLMEISNRACIE